jgi:uncharacterized membrane protein
MMIINRRKYILNVFLSKECYLFCLFEINAYIPSWIYDNVFNCHFAELWTIPFNVCETDVRLSYSNEYNLTSLATIRHPSMVCNGAFEMWDFNRGKQYVKNVLLKIYNAFISEQGIEAFVNYYWWCSLVICCYLY